MARAGSRVDGEHLLRYQQVYQYVLDLIKDQHLHPGDKLPSTTELAALTGVSMISVRRGLSELEQEGKIDRRQGLGTFVGHGRVVAAPNRRGGLLNTLAYRTPQTNLKSELLGLTVGTADKNIAAAMSIAPGAPVWEVRRLRHVGMSAVVLERAMLPLALVPALDEAYLRAGNSMYGYLENQYGLTDSVTEQTFEVDTATEEQRAILGLKDDATVVRIRGISFDANGTAFDCYEQVYGASNFIFYVASADRRELLRPGNSDEWLVKPFDSAGSS